MASKYTLARALARIEDYGGFGSIKFIRFEDNSYVFGHSDENHSRISRGTKEPISAGFVKFRGSNVSVEWTRSMSLDLDPHPYDYDNLPTIISKKWPRNGQDNS